MNDQWTLSGKNSILDLQQYIGSQFSISETGLNGLILHSVVYLRNDEDSKNG